jgi:acyl-CoA reductase-like NAD-dependent aldehyde dehydrogenase
MKSTFCLKPSYYQAAPKRLLYVGPSDVPCLSLKTLAKSTQSPHSKGNMAGIKVLNPYDQSLVCELPYDQGDALERKLEAAHHAYAIWHKLPLDQRIQLVKKGLAKFKRSSEEIARQITQQMGKPIVQSRREVETFFERAEYMVSIAKEALAPDLLPSKPGFVRRIEHTPWGVVLNMGAWNYPLLIPVNVIVPALLAGNIVLLKHSALTPLCGLQFEKAFGELETPNLVTSLVLSHAQAERLILDPRVKYVAFTGSVEGGHKIYQQAAKRFIDAGLELGGKDPAYIAEDADLDFAVANVVDGACYNAGQSCCSVERVYVHRKLYASFLEKAAVLLSKYKLGDPMKETTTMGPLASRSALDALEEKIAEAQSLGAKLIMGGKRLATKGNFFPPTLLANVVNHSRIMQEETFAPVLPVHPVKDDDEAFARMNDTAFGLTASVWTRNAKRAERFAQDLDAGTVFQNRCDYLDPALPWTGARDSGKGSTLSKYGFYQLTRRKSIHFRVGEA